MKKYVTIFFLSLCSMMSFAQSETAQPTFGVELDREVAMAVIEKKTYEDVIVELKSADLMSMFANGVKVTVKDAKTGKRIYKKRFSKSYLYAFPSGTIQVGKGNALIQLILYKSTDYDVWFLDIREKGLY